VLCLYFQANSALNTLSRKVEDLKDENSTLSRKVEDLKDENSTLSRKVEDLEDENSKLRKVIFCFWARFLADFFIISDVVDKSNLCALLIFSGKF
jgi:FtsZ-binding cell division protein ZapB